MKKKTMKSLIQEANSVNAKCMFKYSDYKDNQTKMPYMCNSCGHKWSAVPGSIQCGRGCPECGLIKRANNRKANTRTIQEVLQAAKLKGGKCLSKEYLGTDSKHLFECAKGHKWETSAYNILKGKSWCPTCAGRYNRLDKLREIAKKRDGKLISTKYIDTSFKYTFKCSRGHIFKINVRGLSKGSWCSECSSGLYERITRIAIEQLLGIRLEKSYPVWLKSSSGYQLELDGYNEKHKIAFEHQGSYHYKEVKKSHFNHKGVVVRDEEKLKLCEERGVKVIYVPELTTMTPVSELKSLIISECNRLGIKLTKKQLTKELDLDSAYVRGDVLKEHQEEIKSLKIRVLSTSYLGVDNKHKYECLVCGDVFERTFYSQSKGAGCNKCLDKELGLFKRKIWKDVVKDAANVGLKPSFSYQDYCSKQNKLPYECVKCGFVSMKAPGNVQQGQGCPKCVKVKEILGEDGETYTVGSTVKYSIKDAIEYAKALGGKCLSKYYKNSRTMLEWECSEHHRWEASWENIHLNNSWCKRCASMKLSSDRRGDWHDVVEGAKKSDLILISGKDEYKSNKSKLKVKCKKCGHEALKSVENIKKSSLCYPCSRVLGGVKRKQTSLLKLRDFCNSSGYSFDDNDFVGQTESMVFICKCGKERKTSPTNLIRNPVCSFCKSNKA